MSNVDVTLTVDLRRALVPSEVWLGAWIVQDRLLDPNRAVGDARLVTLSRETGPDPRPSDTLGPFRVAHGSRDGQT